MASQNSYLDYTRNTQYIVYWIIRTSNTVIKSSAVSEADAPRIRNSTGQITVAGLVSLAKLISKKISPIPSTIYR
ncbi:hypothetical protein DPV78_000196 [Talaromyces pinophilus]|nr:hypothetical protein DPV78_000196 [Talaromyces pinophilus]